MKITRIALSGFKRFALSDSKDIDISFTSKLVLLIGTNGSGKSSLLRELSPLPANANDFNKGGYKLIEIDYLGNKYILTNSFDTTGNRFSFICNDEELNQSQTVTVYKELVYKHFKLDSNIFSLLVNDDSFIYYNNQERKSWITKISDNDLTYAISYYNKCREILRDTTGAIKLAKTRLLQESDKLIDQKEYKSLRMLIDDSTKLVDKLLDLRDGGNVDPHQIKAAIQNTENKITRITKELGSMVDSYPRDKEYSTIEAIDTLHIRTMSRINHVQDSIKGLSSSLETLTENLEILKKANNGTRDSLVSQIAEMDKTIGMHNSSIKLSIYYDRPDEVLNSYNTIRGTLEEIAINLCPDPNKSYTKDKYIVKLETYNSLVARAEKLEEVHKVSIAKKHHLDLRKKDSNVTCPKCSHNWYTDYDDLEYRSTAERCVRVGEDLVAIKKTLEALEEELQVFKSQLTYRQSYSSLCNSWLILSPLWSYIDNSDILYTDPRAILQLSEDISSDIKTQVTVQQLISTRTELQNALSLLDKDSKMSLDALKTEYISSNKKLSELNSELRELNNKLTMLKTIRATLTNIDSTRTVLESLLESYNTIMHSAVLFKKKQAINEIIRTIRLYINDKETLIAKQDAQLAVVNNLKTTLDSQIESVTYYKSIEKALSPTEGLIAKSLTGFINAYVCQINGFIKKIWSYPLELLSIELDESLDVNYKFKVQVNDTVTVQDIVRLSSAQKEVVDLAIRVVSMKYLRISEYPLYLDEYASRMDIHHRKSAFSTVNNLVLNSNFSQVFLITHLLDEISNTGNVQVVNLSA